MDEAIHRMSSVQSITFFSCRQTLMLEEETLPHQIQVKVILLSRKSFPLRWLSVPAALVLVCLLLLLIVMTTKTNEHQGFRPEQETAQGEVDGHKSEVEFW